MSDLRVILAVCLTVACGSSTGGSVIDAPPADADPNAPSCTITAPVTGIETAFDVPVMLVAAASDPQDGTLGGASIVWRSTLQTAPLGSGVTLATALPVGSNTVTCVATDSTMLSATSAGITITSLSPFAKINHPGNETRNPIDPVPFAGVGRDLEDGTLTGASLVWTSSIDGAIGTGDAFSRVMSVGIHTITLTVTDSSSNTDVDSITLTIQ